MSKRLFFTRTDYDLCMSYLYAYTQEVIDFALSRAWSIEPAEKTDANRKNVLSRLDNTPDFVFFNGHGTKDAVYGHNDELLLNVDDDALTGTVTFVRSCASLDEFGRSAVKKGAKAVIGYRNDFWIPWVNEWVTTPLKDPAAQTVLKASNLIAFKLLKGAPAGEAVIASKAKSEETILAILTTGEPYYSATLRALINNNDCLDLEGDPNATV